MRSRKVTKGKMIASIIGICLATLLIIFAFSGRYAEGGFKQFGNFFLGSFGMAFYGLMAAVIVACSCTLAGKSLKIPAKYAVFFALTFVAVVMFVHTLTTTYISNRDFSAANGTGYVQLVYHYYTDPIGVPTFGGVVFGSICWALSKVLTVWGAMIVIVLLLGLSLYFVGEFFYSYHTGRLSLVSHKPQPSNSDIEPSYQTTTAPPIPDSAQAQQQYAYKVLFENQTYPEEVSTTPAGKFDVSPQSVLDADSAQQQKATDILFGGYNPPQQEQQPDRPSGNNGNSFFRPAAPTQPVPDDDFIVRGFYNTPEQPKPQDNEDFTAGWKIDTSAEQPKPAAPVADRPVNQQPQSSQPASEQPGGNPFFSGSEPISQPAVEPVAVSPAPTPVQPAAPVAAEPTPAPVRVEPLDEPKQDVDIVDVVAEEPQPPEVKAFADEPTVSTPPVETAPESQGKEEDGSELVAIPGETIIQTPAGPAIQAKFDMVTKDELKKAQETVHKYPKYNQPPMDLLNDITITEDTEADDRARAADAIVKKLAVFKIKVELADTVVGPSVTRYMFNVLSETTRMSQFATLTDDIKACVEAQSDIRIEAPVHGTNQVGIEVANKTKRPVVLRTLLESETFKKAKGNLVFAIGQEITGKVIVGDLSDMPHMLVAGTTGSGKSVVLNCMIVSLIYKYGPEYVRFVMVDPKIVEFSQYNGIPHMLTRETITTPNDALAGMDYLINEMESRYQLFRQNNVSNLNEYNSHVNTRISPKLPYLVFVVDELADLMASSKQAFESKLQRLAQKSRAAGIHIVLATQRPDVKTITGTIKANLPCRIALKVSSQADSMTIINGSGAEKLLGKGDMLYMSPGSDALDRIQGAYVSTEEIRALVKYERETNEVYYDDSISDQIFVSQKQEAEGAQDEDGSKAEAKEAQVDQLCKRALRFWLERNSGKASIASIQRNLGIGFNRAGRIMDTLQRLGYVEALSPSEPNSKPLKVLVTLEEVDSLFPDLPN